MVVWEAKTFRLKEYGKTRPLRGQCCTLCASTLQRTCPRETFTQIPSGLCMKQRFTACSKRVAQPAPGVRAGPSTHPLTCPPCSTPSCCRRSTL